MSRIDVEWMIKIVPHPPPFVDNTFFTMCCRTAINDDEQRCPGCGELVVGADADGERERSKIRWQNATRNWR